MIQGIANSFSKGSHKEIKLTDYMLQSQLDHKNMAPDGGPAYQSIEDQKAMMMSLADHAEHMERHKKDNKTPPRKLREGVL